MTKEFKLPPPTPAPDGWEYTGEIRRLFQGETGRPIHEVGRKVIEHWKYETPSEWYYWVLIPSYSRTVDIFGFTFTVEDVYGTMNPVIPSGWKVKEFAVPLAKDLGKFGLTPDGDVALLSDRLVFWPSRRPDHKIVARPYLILERVA